MLSNPLSRPSRRVSFALVLSYVFDWIVVILAAAFGAAIFAITPNKRPFSLANTDISFPYVTKEKISTATLILCGLVAPAIITFLVVILLVPGPTVPNPTSKALIWRRKLWELHSGWLGLALSLAATLFITNGMKNLLGTPREVYLVNAAICRNHNESIVNDGFRSFPSGHSSFSAAGLIYLSLFIASKLTVAIPFLGARPYSRDASHLAAFPSRNEEIQQRNHIALADPDKGVSTLNAELSPYGRNEAIVSSRYQAAALPVYLLVFAIIPVFVSIYIASTRWSDFKNYGFDILFGYFIGAVTAIFAFRLYYLPISRGAGWSWGPRSSERSFWTGIGAGSYVGGSDNVEYNATANDAEAGPMRKEDVAVDGGHTEL